MKNSMKLNLVSIAIVALTASQAQAHGPVETVKGWFSFGNKQKPTNLVDKAGQKLEKAKELAGAAGSALLAGGSTVLGKAKDAAGVAYGKVAPHATSLWAAATAKLGVPGTILTTAATAVGGWYVTRALWNAVRKDATDAGNAVKDRANKLKDKASSVANSVREKAAQSGVLAKAKNVALYIPRKVAALANKVNPFAAKVAPEANTSATAGKDAAVQKAAALKAQIAALREQANDYTSTDAKLEALLAQHGFAKLVGGHQSAQVVGAKLQQQQPKQEECIPCNASRKQ